MDDNKDWIATALGFWVERVKSKGKGREFFHNELISDVLRWKPHDLPASVTSNRYLNLVLQAMKEDPRLHNTKLGFCYTGTSTTLNVQQQNDSLVKGPIHKEGVYDYQCLDCHLRFHAPIAKVNFKLHITKTGHCEGKVNDKFIMKCRRPPYSISDIEGYRNNLKDNEPSSISTNKIGSNSIIKNSHGSNKNLKDNVIPSILYSNMILAYKRALIPKRNDAVFSHWAELLKKIDSNFSCNNYGFPTLKSFVDYHLKDFVAYIDGKTYYISLKSSNDIKNPDFEKDFFDGTVVSLKQNSLPNPPEELLVEHPHGLTSVAANCNTLISIPTGDKISDNPQLVSTDVSNHKPVSVTLGRKQFKTEQFVLHPGEELYKPVQSTSYKDLALLDDEGYPEDHKSEDQTFYMEDVYDEEEEKFDGNIFVWKGETNEIQKNIARKLSLLKLEKYFLKSSSISTRDKGVALADGDSSSQFLEASLFGQLVVDSKYKIGTTEQQKIFLVDSVISEIFILLFPHLS